MHRRARRDRRELGQPIVDVVDQIGLRQHDDRRGPALVRHHEVSLEPARVVVAIEPHHQEHDVNVGGDDLLLGELAGDLARELAAPRQERLDGPALLTGRLTDRDPVADRRQFVATRGAVQDATRMLDVQFAVGRQDAEDVIELDGDAAGNQPLALVFGEPGRPPGVPAEIGQVDHASIVGANRAKAK